MSNLKIVSFVSVISLGVAFAAGCTITTTPVDPTPAPTPGATVDGGADASPSVAGGCDFGEPNDTREQATAIVLNKTYTGLCVSNPDTTDALDFYEITAPASDVAGGVVELKVSNVLDGGLAEIIVTSSEDNGVIFDSYTTDQGANVTGWLAVSPGAKYKIQVNRFGGSGTRFAYDLSTTYTAVVDAFEPNNKKEDAKSITVGTPISATAAASSSKADLEVGDDQDWFSVTLAAGDASVKMTNVAADYLCDVELLDASGVSVGEKYQTDKGASCVLDATGLTGGSYYVKIHSFAGLPIRGDAHTAVASFELSPYTLVVTQ